MKRDEHKQAVSRVPAATVADIENCEDPFAAADIVCRSNPVEACAIIDSIFPLMAALIIGVLKLRCKEDASVQAILVRAEELQIRGTKGICHEHMQLLKLAGFLCP